MSTREPALERPWWLLPMGRWHPLWWAGIAPALIGLEYVAGPQTQYPVVHVIPVILAAWYSGRRPALALAVAVPLARIVLHMTVWTSPGALSVHIATTLFRGAVIALVGLWFARLSEHERELHRHVQTLEGLLPICSLCKSIRNPAGNWESLETFISTRSEAEFTHGLCPPCVKAHYPDFDPGHDVPDREE